MIERLPNEIVASCQQPGIMAAPHWHAQAEINYVFRGALEYEMPGYGVRIGAGDVALFWGGLPHRVLDTDEDTYFHVIHLPLFHFFRLRLSPHLQQRLMLGERSSAPEPSQRTTWPSPDGRAIWTRTTPGSSSMRWTSSSCASSRSASISM